MCLNIYILRLLLLVKQSVIAFLSLFSFNMLSKHSPPLSQYIFSLQHLSMYLESLLTLTPIPSSRCSLLSKIACYLPLNFKKFSSPIFHQSHSLPHEPSFFTALTLILYSSHCLTYFRCKQFYASFFFSLTSWFTSSCHHSLPFLLPPSNLFTLHTFTLKC